MTQACKHQAMSYLARREHSMHELAEKLQSKGFLKPEISETLEWLKEQDYQSDARFSQAMIRHKANLGYGPRLIRAFLSQVHQITDPLISDAFEDLQRLGEIDFEARRQEIIEKLKRTEKYQKAPQKIREYLYRKGY